jgi:hypothetical protein
MLPMNVHANVVQGEEPENKFCNPDGGSSSGWLMKLMSGIELQNQSFASSPLEAK